MEEASGREAEVTLQEVCVCVAAVMILRDELRLLLLV